MSVIVETEVGRFRKVTGLPRRNWLWECPGCGTWAQLSEEQWQGKISVNHDADGCEGHYHQTHDFESALAQNSLLTMVG